MSKPAADDELNAEDRDHIDEIHEHMLKVSNQLMTKLGSVLTSFENRIDEIGEEFKDKIDV
eukprot:12404626-Karenia_brevis.AAC.1